ncbi:MAG: hypothetical protein ABJQ85_01905 [Rhizobiaceae bacterium]
MASIDYQTQLIGQSLGHAEKNFEERGAACPSIQSNIVNLNPVWGENADRASKRCLFRDNNGAAEK